MELGVMSPAGLLVLKVNGPDVESLLFINVVGR